MTNTKKDNNGVPTMSVASNADGSTIINVSVNPTSHGVNFDDGTTGSDFARTTLKRDQNSIPILGGVSNADGLTPTAIYGKTTGELLINSS